MVPAKGVFNLSSFAVHFLLCNLSVSIITSMLLAAKYILRKYLPGKLQYDFWILLCLLLSAPFLSFRPFQPAQILHLFQSLQNKAADTSLSTFSATSVPFGSSTAGWMNDFAVSAGQKMPSALNSLLFALWILGIFTMLFLAVKARIHLYRLEQSGLPLQNLEIRKLYLQCLQEMDIRKEIPVYSSAFFQSPVLIGIFRPKIFLPLPLISGCDMQAIRYMLLHELQHYKHCDSLINYILYTARCLYWFNPVILFALKDTRTDREKACDSAVLHRLSDKEYFCYGNTLINFAEKMSSPGSFLASGMGGNVSQLKKRIQNIASYRKATKGQRLKGQCCFILIALLLLQSISAVPVYASVDYAGLGLPDAQTVVSADLSAFFEGYDGCFVFYDVQKETWTIYNETLASLRVSPDSTYKIYSALCALENGSISPASNSMEWNGHAYPIGQWNKNQTLSSALRYSVNWYFQELDQDVGMDSLSGFYAKIDYGNQDLSGGINSFWLESSLKVSAIEQVELLQKLYANEYQFAPENIEAVKNALKLSSSGAETLYGKTCTGNRDGKNRNGWFIGYVESQGSPYFFAANIRNGADASGKTASSITLEILQSWGILPYPIS